jgi:uncharacterized caspase-like protein
MKRHRWIIFICIAVGAVLFGGNAGAQRGIKIRSQLDGTTLQRRFSTGANHALVIGIDEYENHPNLKTAVNDADAVAKLLEEKYFFPKQNIILLKDRYATTDRIMGEFRDLVAEKVKEGDNVFIYYAGHGWFDDILESGYWVTAEATKSPATFLGNNTIYKFIAALDKKGVQHVLLVTDSCFSGSFTKDHRAIETDIDDRYFREKYGKPSRNILTSGGLEPVEDAGKEGHSIFAYYFLKTLRDNPHPYVSAKQVGVQVEELVTRNSTQTPVSKFIHGVGDEGGQFFFINRRSGTPKVSPGPITAETQERAELEKERERLEQERLELERLKAEIDRKELEAERERLEAEKKKLEMAKLPPKPKYSPQTIDLGLVHYSQAPKTFLVELPDNFSKVEIGVYGKGDDTPNSYGGWNAWLKVNGKMVWKFKRWNKKEGGVIADYTRGGHEVREATGRDKYLNATGFFKPGRNQITYYHYNEGPGINVKMRIY